MVSSKNHTIHSFKKKHPQNTTKKNNDPRKRITINESTIESSLAFHGWSLSSIGPSCLSQEIHRRDSRSSDQGGTWIPFKWKYLLYSCWLVVFHQPIWKKYARLVKLDHETPGIGVKKCLETTGVGWPAMILVDPYSLNTADASRSQEVSERFLSML